MLDLDAHGQPERPSIGRHVTVAFDGAPDGEAYVAVRQDDRSLVLHPVRQSGTHPRLGERVRCSSVAGEWATTVSSCRDGELELSLPRWLSRGVQRRWRRVLVACPVRVQIAGGEWAGRLQDVSVGGAAVMLERAADLRPGAAVSLALAGGTATATVRSVRAHAHPLLVVAGVSWNRLDPSAREWLVAEVAARSRRA